MLVEINKCAASQCQFNRSGQCSAPEIELSPEGACLTLKEGASLPGTDMVPPADMSKMANSGMRMMQNAEQMDKKAGMGDDDMNAMLRAAGLL